MRGNQQLQFATQWKFSIIYSSTYQVPVLYFNVQDTNGNPVGRQHLLEILRQEHRRSAFTASNDFTNDTWEFVSQEENPVTGLCSFFLHPCQSTQRLQQFLTSVATTIYQNEDCTKLEQKSINTEDFPFTKECILWSWMSMILPAIGQSIPPFYFRHIQGRIAHPP